MCVARGIRNVNDRREGFGYMCEMLITCEFAIGCEKMCKWMRGIIVLGRYYISNNIQQWKIYILYIMLDLISQ